LETRTSTLISLALQFSHGSAIAALREIKKYPLKYEMLDRDNLPGLTAAIEMKIDHVADY
jgi:hypothetical protein